MHDMKYVVTGGAGFIGSHIARRLVNDGHQITIVDNLSRGDVKNFADFRDDVDFSRTDILDLDELTKVARDADGMFHQAALASVPQSFSEPELYNSVNVVGTKNVFELAERFGFKVVYASSSSVYGPQEVLPIKEEAPKNPVSPYAQNKLDCETAAKHYTNQGVKIIGLRYFNVFGIGQNPHYAGVIPMFLEKLLGKKPPIIEGDGNQVRSFTFVDDVVDANILAMNSSADGVFLNIASERFISINDLARVMIEMSGLDISPEYTEPRRGDIKNSRADTSLAKHVIGWAPKTSLAEGLKTVFSQVGITSFPAA